MKIDAHQHFWKYSPIDHSWITDEMKSIRRDFFPDDLHPTLNSNSFDGCVAVQADQSETETDLLLKLAEENEFIKGVVGWIDLRNQNVSERLQHYSAFPKFKGVRHIVQSEPDDFLLNEDFCRGVAMLTEYDLTYDILIYPRQLKTTIEFVRKFPGQKFVIDHIAKPDVRDWKENDVEDWKKKMIELSKMDNVYCKLSGMVTEANWNSWKLHDFTRYIDVVLNSFGSDRLMFGSDWPVCLVAGNYEEVCQLVEEHIEHLSAYERQLIWGLTATDFYKL